jgi:hypothetical protein
MKVALLRILLAAALLAASACSGGSGSASPDSQDADDADSGIFDGSGDPGLQQDDQGDEAILDGDGRVEPDQIDGSDDAGDPDLADGDSDQSDTVDGSSADGGDSGDPDCSSTGSFDYSCDIADPESCPGGFCVLGMCIGPVLDPERWAACGDGSCGPCEDESSCPADCGSPPETSGTKEYGNATTITVWVHGFYNKSADEMASMVYGEEDGCGGILSEFENYGIQRPCGNTDANRTAPNQLIGVEYYGGVPAAWLSATDVEEIENLSYDGIDALHRYAMIVAKFISNRLAISGATHVNLACHSMGCLICRYVIEHDLEGLASGNHLVRWFTSAGVIAGAQLARLYDNPTVRDGAQLLGMELNDFVIMHPDFVQDSTCIWDHKLHSGNNPLFAGMLIHHACACDPQIQEALGIALLDIYNPTDDPNDGIMFTADEYFHSQDPAASFSAPDGTLLASTHNLAHFDHMTLPGTQAAALMATASLFHRRKVFITLDQIELLADREHHDALDGEHGDPPAEIIAESQVRYNPYVQDTFGQDILVHDDQLEYRTPDIFTQNQGEIVQPELSIFEGPVFDEMSSLQLDLELLEVDWYPHREVREYIFDYQQGLVGFHGQLQLTNGVVTFENENARVRLKVRVVQLY